MIYLEDKILFKMSSDIKICLNMIVKNESKVIKRCLDSISSVADDIIISDTGSTDNTIEIMENWIKEHGKNGKIVSHDWLNFEHNRNLSLNAAKEWIKERDHEGKWYILFIDADDYLVLTSDKLKDTVSKLSLDQYSIDMKCGNSTYSRVFMIKVTDNVEWNWSGVLHETLMGVPNSYTRGYLKLGYIQASREGARSQDVMKYMKDALILEEELKNNDWTSTRNVFYLAQSYRDYGGKYFLKMAEKLYIKRFEMGGWAEERYLSLVEAGKARWNRGKMDHKTIELFIKAFNFRSTRLEAPYYIVRYYRMKDLHVMGYTFGKSLLELPYTNDVLFVAEDIHKWRFMDELSICACWAADKTLYRELCEKILLQNIDDARRNQIVEDLKNYGQ